MFIGSHILKQRLEMLISCGKLANAMDTAGGLNMSVWTAISRPLWVHKYGYHTNIGWEILVSISELMGCPLMYGRPMVVHTVQFEASALKLTV